MGLDWSFSTDRRTAERLRQLFLADIASRQYARAPAGPRGLFAYRHLVRRR